MLILNYILYENFFWTVTDKNYGLENARSSTARIPTRRHGGSANPPFWIKKKIIFYN